MQFPAFQKIRAKIAQNKPVTGNCQKRMQVRTKKQNLEPQTLAKIHQELHNLHLLAGFCDIGKYYKKNNLIQRY